MAPERNRTIIPPHKTTSFSSIFYSRSVAFISICLYQKVSLRFLLPLIIWHVQNKSCHVVLQIVHKRRVFEDWMFRIFETDWSKQPFSLSPKGEIFRLFETLRKVGSLLVSTVQWPHTKIKSINRLPYVLIYIPNYSVYD